MRHSDACKALRRQYILCRFDRIMIYNNTQEVFDAFSKIASEPNPCESLEESNKCNNTNNNKNSNNTKSLLKMWYYSIIISFIPVTSVILYVLISESLDKFLEQIILTLSSSEMVYIAISSTTISTNDMSRFGSRKQRWIRINQILVIFGAILYTAMRIAEYNGNNKNTVLMIVFIVLYSTISFILGRASYIKD